MTVSLGMSLVDRLKMPVHEDPMQQRSQASFAFLQTVGAFAAAAQAGVILGTENWTLAPVQFRLALNLGLCALLLSSLFLFTARGRLGFSATTIAIGMLLYDALFAYGFSLRTTPTPAIVTLCLLGAVGLVVPPTRILVWGILCALVLGFGQIVTPVWLFQPSPMSVASVLIFAISFFGLILMEFRRSMLDGLTALQAQSTALAEANIALQHTLLQRDELSEKLATAERMKAMGSMAGNIAHDFNNMLTVIRGYSDRIAADTALESPKRDEVDQLVQAVSRASNVSRDVLDFAAPISFAFATIDLVDLIDELMPALERTLHSKVKLERQRASEPCLVCADAEQLRRVLLNLTANARDATAAGGTIRLALSCTLDRVHLRVSDEGHGVPESMRERIFEPFYTTKGTTGGGGLGLASSYAIVRQHQGYITVQDAPHGGAIFTVDLPRVNADAVSDESDGTTHGLVAPTTVPKTLSGSTILLVEDDEPLRRLIERMLSRAGAAVHALDNGTDAVSVLQSRASRDAIRVDIVITDLRLPIGSGAAVVATALQLSYPVAVVAISGFLEDASVAQLAAQEKLHFLPKPFAEQQLMEAIATAQRYAARKA